MTHRNGNDGNDYEARVNALLDGELDEGSIEALKRAAGEDHALARAIIEAYELQRGMDQLGIERAPASLRRKLRNIPRRHGPVPALPRWAPAGAVALVTLLAIGVVMTQPWRPSEAEVAQARRDLATAFAYIDKAGIQAGSQIHDVLGRELRSGVKDNISKHMPYTEQSLKEEST